MDLGRQKLMPLESNQILSVLVTPDGGQIVRAHCKTNNSRDRFIHSRDRFIFVTEQLFFLLHAFLQRRAVVQYCYDVVIERSLGALMPLHRKLYSNNNLTRSSITYPNIIRFTPVQVWSGKKSLLPTSQLKKELRSFFPTCQTNLRFKALFVCMLSPGRFRLSLDQSLSHHHLCS